jgi:hypothetical protein
MAAARALLVGVVMRGGRVSSDLAARALVSGQPCKHPASAVQVVARSTRF